MNIRNLFYTAAIGLTFFLSACEKEETQDPSNNNNNPGNQNIENNTLYAGSNTGPVNKYTAHQPTDVNTNKDYINVFVFKDNVANSTHWIELLLHEIPSGNKTLTWQSGSSAPGDLQADEFVFRMKMNSDTWYGVYATNGWQTTGTINAVVDGNKLVISFEDIELADNFISTNVTKTEKVSGKITLNLDDLQNLQPGPTAIYDLIN